MGPELVDLVDSLLQINPYDRLGAFGNFHKLKAHPYFSDIDWVRLKNRELMTPAISILIAADSR